MIGYSAMFQGRKCTCQALVLHVTLLAFLCVRVEAIETFDVEDYCGFSVSRYDTAGSLQLHAASFFGRHGHRQQCTVKVAPKQVEGGWRNGKVLFYFTEFDLPGACADLNVSLFDGSSASGPFVAGAPSPLCGHNRTLVAHGETSHGRIFTTNSPFFVVQVNWTDPAVIRTAGRFALTFSSYYDGPCDDSADVVKCLNSRCTAKTYHCHADIEACGDGEKSVCDAARKAEEDKDRGVLQNIMDFIEKEAKNIGIVIVIAVVLYFASKTYYAIRHSDMTVSEYISFKLFGRRRSSRQNNFDQSRSRSSSVELNQRTDTTEPLTRRDSFSSDHQNRSGTSAPPPSYDDVGPAPAPLAPPPSYDDFISNTDKYDDKPAPV